MMQSITYEDVVSNIRNIISQKGMKQVFVAEKAGFTKQELSNILNGHKLLRVEHLPNLARALEVEISDLYPKKNCPTKQAGQGM